MLFRCCNLPNGARIVSGRLAHDALGGSTTLSVGYAAHNNAAGTAVSAVLLLIKQLLLLLLQLQLTSQTLLH
jgi:hypothetical protein